MRTVSARRDALALVILFLLPLILLGKTTIGQQVLVPALQLTHFPAWETPGDSIPPWDVLYWDDLAQLLPWQKEAQRSIRAGRIPLWNHSNGCGAPLLANSQTSALSPPWLVLAGINLALAQGWLALFQLWIAGAGAYAFFRLYRLRVLPSLLGAAVYQLSGWSLCWVEFPNRHGPVAWFPVCLWLLSLSVRGGVLPRIGAALAVALSVVSSHLQFEFYLFVGLAIFAVFEAVGGGRHNADGLRWIRTRPLVIFVVVAAMALMLSAPQLLPSIELGRWSQRVAATTPTWEHYSAQYHYWMPAWWGAQAFVPGFFGYPSQGSVPAYVDPGPPIVLHFSAEFYEFCVFVGIIPLLLACQGLRQWRRYSVAPFLIALGGMALLLATGSILNAVFYFGIPKFSAMAGSARMLYLFAFAAAGLAAIGLDALKLASVDGRSALVRLSIDGIGLLIAGIVLCAAAAFMLTLFPGAVTSGDWTQTLAERAGGGWFPLMLLAAAVCIIFLVIHYPQRRAVGEVALVILSVLQLLVFGSNVIQTAPPSQLFPVTPTIRAVQELRPFRIMEAAKGWTVGAVLKHAPGDPAYPAPGSSQAAVVYRKGPPENLLRPAPLPPNTATYYDGLRSLESYDSLNSSAYNEYVTELQGNPTGAEENGNLILLSNIDSPLVAEAGVDTVLSATPQTSTHLNLVRQVGDVYIYRLRNPEPAAYVEGDSGVARGGTLPRVRRWNAGQIDVENVVGPGKLVVLDSNVPGWTAKVDGAAAPVQTYRGLFKSLYVERGVHQVALCYRPLSFRIGVFLSAVAAAMLIGTLAGAWGCWQGMFRIEV